MDPLTEADFKALVVRALHEVTPAQHAGLLRANLSYLRELLEKDLE